MAASYANGSSDAFYGTNATGEALAKELYNYCVNKPEIPDVAMSFSKPDVKAYVDGNVQRTENIQFNASSQQKITMDLPKGVKLHNVSTGNVSAAGASVTIGGGTTFYLSAPLTQTKDVSATFSAKMKGSITKDYSAYKLTTNASVQDLAFVFGEGVADEKYVSLKVSWIEQATIEIVKKDDTADVNLAGAVFGVYSDEACTKLITQMPATDKNGKSSVTIIKTQDTVYLKEITAPQGYVVNATATNVKLVASKTSAVTVENKEQLAELTIYKEGQVLTGAEVSEMLRCCIYYISLWCCDLFQINSILCLNDRNRRFSILICCRHLSDQLCTSLIAVYTEYCTCKIDIRCIVFLYDFDRSLFNPGHL